MSNRQPILGPNGWKGLFIIVAGLAFAYWYYDVEHGPEPRAIANDPLCIQQITAHRTAACREHWSIQAAEELVDPLGLRQADHQ